MKTAKTPAWLTVKQVAARYSISTATVWRWSAEQKGFPSPVKFSSSCTRWSLAELEQWEGSRDNITKGDTN